MSTFNVKIGSSDGALEVRRVHGRDAAVIRRRFVDEGFYVFSVDRVFEPGALLGRNKVPIKPFLLFNKEFRGLLKAGMPIVQGLDILLKRMKPGALRSVLEQVRERLTKGESLSSAFQSFNEAVPRYYPALLHAGEQSGSLVEVLGRFIEQEERLRKARKRFSQAMTYPLLLLLVGLASLYVVLTRAMPQFAAIYADSDKQLPFATRVVMGLSEWVLTNNLYLILGFIGLTVAGFFYFRTDAGALIGERLLGKVPLVGAMWRLQNQNIFARAMRLLITGGVPVPEALRITADAVPSRVFSMQLNRAQKDLLQGRSLQEVLETHTQLDDMVHDMIRVGEESGSLDDMFEFLAEHGEEKSEDYLELVSNLIAPLMLLFVGLIIAFLVVAMYLPMFSSYDVLSG